ncbi:Atxe2 family lasso peptide isopeptidase [Sphingomonas oryzagri]
MRLSLTSLALLGAVVSFAPSGAAASCHNLDWQDAPQLSAERALMPTDLVRLRDIGPAGDGDPAEHVMTMSPNGKWVAFQLHQADPETNLYCLAMVIQPLDGGAARFVDTGGDFILAPDGIPTDPATAIGTARIVTPRWSPEGRWFAFIKRLDGVDRIWRADLATGHSSPITPAGLDVADFRVADSDRIVVRLASVPAAGAAALLAESRSGYHYDDRFVPMRASVPIVARSESRYATFDITSGRRGDANASEIALFDQNGSTGSTSLVSPCALSRKPKAAGVLAPTRIELACRGAPPAICRIEACEDSYGPLWLAGAAVRFLRREGWARMTTEIYDWRPGSKRPRRLFATDDALIDCQPRTADELICLRETSQRPRHIVAIDLRAGRLREIADPNPEFAHLALGTVERIKLTSSLGIPAFADIVLPTGYQPGRRYPLIIVQYQSRGFLRGGVGDEFPIQLFANHGFVVLSAQRPGPAGGVGDPVDAIDIDRRNLVDFADRRNVLSVIEQGVDTLVARGIVDPAAVGITGLSDGSSTVQYAAIHSSRFAAGIVSGCCWEPEQAGALGPAFNRRLAAIGWPGVSADASAFWREISIVQNAPRVQMPLLFEAADDEFRIAVDSVTALREAGKPADLFVFPGEFHLKWQPAHRLAAYQRGLDWFSFWLRDQLPDDPRRRAEAERWAAMRQTRAP